MTDLGFQLDVNEARIDDMPMGILFDLTASGHAGSMAARLYVAHFMKRGGEYMAQDDALGLLRKMTRRDYFALRDTVLDAVQEISAPKKVERLIYRYAMGIPSPIPAWVNIISWAKEDGVPPWVWAGESKASPKWYYRRIMYDRAVARAREQ